MNPRERLVDCWWLLAFILWTLLVSRGSIYLESIRVTDEPRITVTVEEWDKCLKCSC